MNQENYQMGEVAVPTPVEEQALRYQPDRQVALENYEIHIQFLSRGCIVRVGCKSIAFENVTEAMKELHNYVANPYEVQEQWKKELGN